MGELSEAMAALDKQQVLRATQEGLASGADPLILIEEARKVLWEVGREFGRAKFFLMELMEAAQTFKSAAEVLAPKIEAYHGKMEAKGKVLLGTVAADIHDLGKNIVKILLECRGLEVVDVPRARFVENVKIHHPQVVGLTALLTASVPEMNRVVEALEQEGVRKGVKVIVGGGIVGEIQSSQLTADHATTDANEGVHLIDRWIQDVR